MVYIRIHFVLRMPHSKSKAELLLSSRVMVVLENSRESVSGSEILYDV